MKIIKIIGCFLMILKMMKDFKKYWDKDIQSLNQRKRIRNKLIFLLYVDTLILFLLTNLLVAKIMIFISN